MTKVRFQRHRPQPSLRRVAIMVVLGFLGIGIVLIPWTVSLTDTTPDAVRGASSRVTPVSKMTTTTDKKKMSHVNAQGKDRASPPPPVEQDESAHRVERSDERRPGTTTTTTSRDQYHTVISTGCSTFQDWQSYVFFYHLLHSGQEGPVTRIASGCSEEDAHTLTDIFEKEIATMAPGRFRLHLTPDFSRIKRGTAFKYFNKPFGMQHWMQHALGYPDTRVEHDDTIIILLDPDQILTRAFTNDFTHSSEKWRLKNGYKLKVEHGSPFAAQYGYGLQWKRKVNMENVFQGHSPAADMTDKEAMDYYYGMGPPYLATGKDMYTLVTRWAEIVPRVHDDYPHLLAEMFAFNLAAAHEGIRFTIAHSFMVSDVFAGGEGWKLIEAVPEQDICANFPEGEYPHVIHYCQRYYVGKWFIGKYKLRKDFISCESPLLVMPPANLAAQGYTEAITPSGERKLLDAKHMKLHAFMVCTMIRALNDAAIYYKDHHCTKENANYEYSYVFHKDMNLPDEPR